MLSVKTVVICGIATRHASHKYEDRTLERPVFRHHVYRGSFSLPGRDVHSDVSGWWFRRALRQIQIDVSP